MDVGHSWQWMANNPRQVVFLNWGLTDTSLDSMPAGIKRASMRRHLASAPASGSPPPHHGLGLDIGDGKGRALVQGEWNTALYGSLGDAGAGGYDPNRGDVIVSKDRMSGMWHENTELSMFLTGNGDGTTRPKSRKFTTLLFAGVNTDQCVLGTLADAYSHGWDCVMLEDCCATPTPGGHEVTITNCAVGTLLHAP